jgi:hypothetical protein
MLRRAQKTGSKGTAGYGSKISGRIHVLGAGWSLVWRRQRLLWWIYVLSLAFGWFAALPLESEISPVLDHSLASAPLYHGFGIGAFVGLMMSPGVDTQAPGTTASVLGVVFLVLMIFLTGGILRVYNEDRTYVTGEFFGACGQYFWRFVRLLVFLLFALIPPVLIYLAFHAWSGHLADKMANPAPSLVVGFGGTLLVLFLLMWVRLWFDMAEVIAVAENQYASRRAVARAFRLTWRNFGPLFWIYFRLSILAWLGTALCLWVWVRFIPAEGITRSFLITQAIVFLWILTRLWQRASETLWYQANGPVPERIPETYPPSEPLVLAAESPAGASGPPSEPISL